MTAADLWDDPEKDYRTRYQLPTQFIWREEDWARIDFDSYMSMVRSMLPSPPATILDVGCGPGMGAARLIDSGFEVHGIDYSERAIGFAHTLVPLGRFVVGDIRRLGDVAGLEEHYDAAICVEVLEHVPPEFRSDVLRGIAGRLLPGGRVVLSTPTDRMHTNRWDYPRATEQQLRDALVAAGFEIERVAYQHAMSMLMDPRFWRLISNRYVDLVGLRRVIRRLVLRRPASVGAESDAGRLIVVAARSAT
ncbi:MAG: methyltransferase domain-containing protein [Actinomycetota bacterium]